MHWLDFSRHGMRLDACRLEDGSLSTVLRGADGHQEAARRLGYAPDEAGRWRRPGGLPPFGEVAKAFPDVDVVEVDQEDVLLPLDAPFAAEGPMPHRDGEEDAAARAEVFREAALAAAGLNLRAFQAHLRAEGIPSAYQARYLTAARETWRVLGAERLSEGLRAGHDPRALVAEFAAHGGSRAVSGTNGLAEFALVHLRDFLHRLDNDLPPRQPAAPDAELDRAFARMDETVALAARGTNPANSYVSNFRKMVKLFGVPFVARALRDPAGAREEVFNSPRTAHLSVPVRGHVWGVRGLLNARPQRAAEVLAAWDRRGNADGAAPAAPAPGR